MKTIPKHVLEDEILRRRLKVGVGEAVAWSIGESDWRKFAILFQLADRTVDRHRFLRSLSWNDPDHEGMVIELIDDIFPNNPDAFFWLFDQPSVQSRMKSKHSDLLDAWEGKKDSLIEAISHSVAEVAAVKDVIDLETHTSRIQRALPSDPKAAIGAVKNMLEATMKTNMDARGKPLDKNIKFPDLTTKCMTELGLIPNTVPISNEEKHIRKIASAAKQMIESANDFRNSAGGHGEVVGKEREVSATDASLVASTGLILSAWLLRKHAET